MSRGEMLATLRARVGHVWNRSTAERDGTLPVRVPPIGSYGVIWRGLIASVSLVTLPGDPAPSAPEFGHSVEAGGQGSSRDRAWTGARGPLTSSVWLHDD